MLYLLDANVLIRAHHDYYPLDRVEGFWTWICDQARRGSIKMPSEIHNEVVGGTDELAKWIGRAQVKNVLLLDEEVDQQVLQRVLDHGYGRDLTEDEIDEVGRDPFLVAYAMMGDSRAVVTKEVSKPSRCVQSARGAVALGLRALSRARLPASLVLCRRQNTASARAQASEREAPSRRRIGNTPRGGNKAGGCLRARPSGGGGTPRSGVAPARSTPGTSSQTRLAAELPAATDATFCLRQSTSHQPRSKLARRAASSSTRAQDSQSTGFTSR